MITRLELSVACTPVGMPRPRSRVVRTKRGKYIAHAYYPDAPGRTEKSRKAFEPFRKAAEFKAAIMAATTREGLPAEPWIGPVRVTIEAFFERPQYLLKKSSPEGLIPHTTTPDRDNVDKAVLDALKEAGLVRDDAQVWAGGVTKWYVAKGCAPGVRIVAEVTGMGEGLFTGG